MTIFRINEYLMKIFHKLNKKNPKNQSKEGRSYFISGTNRKQNYELDS